MTDKKIADLTAIAGADLADGDEFVVVDVSDTTMDATGTTKKIAKSELASVFGGGGSFPTYYQVATPSSPADGDTWMKQTADDDSGVFTASEFGLPAYRWNATAAAWRPIAPVLLDDSGNLLGYIEVTDSEAIISWGNGTVAVTSSNVSLQTSTHVLGIDDTTGLTFDSLPIGGNTIVVATSDPGAIGAGAFWLKTGTAPNAAPIGELFIRNGADDGWNPILPAHWRSSGSGTMAWFVHTDDDDFQLSRFDTLGNDRNEIDLDDSSSSIEYFTADDVPTSTSLNAFGHRFNFGKYGSASGYQIWGTVDPTVDPGVDHDSFAAAYFRDAGSGVLEIWYSTGTGAMEWAKLTP